MSKCAVLDDLRRMPYFKNYAAASGAVHAITGHEDAVKDIFLKNGLVECPTAFKKAIPLNSFVSQPNGSQKSPDFLVRFGCETIYKFECKLPKGVGLWPAIWLSCDKTWPPEIDILEAYSNEKGDYKNDLQSNFHYDFDKNKKSSGARNHPVYSN